MKITNYILIFFTIVIPLAFVLDFKIDEYQLIAANTAHYNELIDMAVYDAMNSLVEADSGTGDIVNKKRIVENFYESLFAGFGVMDSLATQQTLKMYVPVITVVEVDGISIYYSDYVLKNGISSVQQYWTEKIKFVYKETGGTIYFSTNDFVTVIINGTTEVYEGNATDIGDKYSSDPVFMNYYNNSVLKKAVTDPDFYDQTRKSTVIDVVGSNISYYVNNHNRIADSYGIKYNFNFPQSALDNFNRNIDDTSLLVLFQGYPIGITKDTVYNKSSFGGARTTKNYTYITQQGDDGFYYYHKNICKLLNAPEEVFYSQKKAAESGAYACEVCKP